MYLYREDLTPFNVTEIRFLAGTLAVGWLDRVHPFATGPAPAHLMQKLLGMMETRVPFCIHASKLRGTLECKICGERSFSSIDPLRRRLVGSSTIWLPSGTQSYVVAPSLIAHYIDGHAYLPPQLFWESIENFDENSPFDAQEQYEVLAKQATKASPAW